LFGLGCAVPAGAEEPIIEGGSSARGPDTSIGKGDCRARRLVPRVLAELLKEVRVTGSLPNDEADCVVIPGDALDGGRLSKRLARQVLGASKFTNLIAVQVDSTQPKGQVLGTVPQTGEITALDAPIQVQVSLGNQYLMPDLRGQFWTDAEPLLLSLGWQRDWTKLANAQNSGYPSNAVATQSPAPGTPVKFSDPITLSFAQ